MKAKLVSVFQNIENISNSEFLAQLSFLKESSNEFEYTLFDTVSKCITGDPDIMNEWLFSLPSNYSGVIVWLAQVKYQDSTRFVWLIGSFDPKTQTIRNFIDTNWYKTLSNPLLTCPRKPPYLVYLNTFAQSKWQQGVLLNNEDKVSDFSVFQVEYTGDKVRDDIDQLMPMNADFLTNQAFQTYEFMKLSCDIELLEYFKVNVLSRIDLLSKFHTELHNYGHFVGAFPYEKPAKDCDSYEAVEEFKACLMAILLMADMAEDITLSESFTLLVICTRIFGYGLRSFLVEEKTAELVREISVGVFFFETLKKAKVLTLKPLVHISISEIIPTIKVIATTIYKVEEKAKLEGLDNLIDYSIQLFTSSYPNKQLSEELDSIYSLYT